MKQRHPEDPSGQVEAVFLTIQRERMQDVPILNPALRVEAVGFKPWQGRWLGILITPWCMNLMLLPAEPTQWRSIAAHERLFYHFPAGDFAFLGGHEEGLGEYHSCALCSPMAQFSDQGSARDVAIAALAALMTPSATADATGAASDAPASTEAAPAMTKREFIGKIFPRINS